MTRLQWPPMSDVGKSILFRGVFLVFFCTFLPTSQASSLSGLCSTFDNAGQTFSLVEGVPRNFTIYTFTAECQDAACLSANTSCTSACAGCQGYDGVLPMTVKALGVNDSAVPGVSCSIGNSSTRGVWPAICLATNNLAAKTGYTIKLTIINGTTNATLASKSATLNFIAGDIVIPYCWGSIENGTNKVYLGYDNFLLIYLMDAYNNTVGARTGRPGLTPITFNVTITWNPDDGSKVSLSTLPVVDTRGDYGYYTALIMPTKVGNYLAKISSNGTAIGNSPIGFQAFKGKKTSFASPLTFRCGWWTVLASVLYITLAAELLA